MQLGFPVYKGKKVDRALFFLLTLIATTLFLFLLGLFLPKFASRNTVFGIRFSEEARNSDATQELINDYQKSYGTYGGIPALVFIILYYFYPYMLLYVIAMDIPLLALIILYLVYYKKARELKATFPESEHKSGHILEERDAQDVNNDRHWKYGVLYYNKEDPAIWVKRRVGIGHTLNFGNPKAVIVFFVLTGLLIFMGALGIVMTAK